MASPCGQGMPKASPAWTALVVHKERLGNPTPNQKHKAKTKNPKKPKKQEKQQQATEATEAKEAKEAKEAQEARDAKEATEAK